MNNNYLFYIAVLETFQLIINILTLGAAFTILELHDRTHL